MKHGIFISYSDFDKDKVDLIVDELKGHDLFFPIVIAFNREALKPLAKKVADGIIDAKIIIPILTTRSIATQWINQEIGFATALDKQIMPVVESTLIDKLKGFIHKQIDLPYSYSSNNSKAIENKSFLKGVRHLIEDLENQFKVSITQEPVTKSELEKSLEQIDRINEEKEFQNIRRSYLHSEGGLIGAKKEVFRIHSEIEEKKKMFEEKQIYFGVEKQTYEPTYILRCGGFSFSIEWFQKYANTTQDSVLLVRRWRGNYGRNGNGFRGEEPKVLLDLEFTFDINRKEEIIWLNHSDKKHYTSSQIIDSCLSWLVEQASKNR